MVDNAEIALAKCDMAIARLYARQPEHEQVFSLILDEYHKACAVVTAAKSTTHLLEQTPWLRESISRRTPYIDTLNLIQITIMRRLDEAARAGDERLQERYGFLLRFVIQGIAAGLRTTG